MRRPRQQRQARHVAKRYCSAHLLRFPGAWQCIVPHALMRRQPILMGVVGRPHGVRGLVHVHSYTAEPADLARYNPLLDEAGRPWTLAWRGEGVAELRDAAGRPVADRTAAERLVNTRLHVERHRLPAPDSEEFYLADLVGLEARDAAGARLGRVAAVHDYGAGTSLEIERATLASVIVPFTRAAVPDIDVTNGHLTVVPPGEIEMRDTASIEMREIASIEMREIAQ